MKGDRVLAQGSNATPTTPKMAAASRSLKYSFTNRFGLPSASGARVPPALSRALTLWLETGSILVVAAPRGSGKSSVISTWLSTRAERMVWVEGSEVHESSDGLGAALEGLYEIGMLTQFERMAFTTMEDTKDVFLRENTPVVMILNNSHLLKNLQPLEMLAQRAAPLSNARFILLTDEPVDTSMALISGVTVLCADNLSDPLDALIDRSPTDSRTPSEVVEEWARRRDTSGGLFLLLKHLAQYLSVPLESAGLNVVEDLHGAIAELSAVHVVEPITAAGGRRLWLAPEFRSALQTKTSSHPYGDEEAFHLAIASDNIKIGYTEGVIFHLARAGRHREALEALTDLPDLGTAPRSRLESLRDASAAIDLKNPEHGITMLVKRLLIALIPPFESAAVREEIQEALRFAQENNTAPISPECDADITIAHVVGLLALGRFNEARLLGRPLADSMLDTPWLDLASFGAVPARVWAAQAAAELLQGRIEDADRFASVARESAAKAKTPYNLYTSTAAVAAIEAVNNELVASELDLAEAQRLYRMGGWPRTVSQTPEFVARFFLGQAWLDVTAISDLRQDIAVVADINGSLRLLMKACECFVHIFSGEEAQTRVAVRQLTKLIGDYTTGALFRDIGAETAFEALLRLGEPAVAIELLEAVGSQDPDCPCLRGLVAAAWLDLRDPSRALSAIDGCLAVNPHHTQFGLAQVLLVRAAAHEMLGNTEVADESFAEVLLMQDSSPSPYLFLLVPRDICLALWARVAEKPQWRVVQTFLHTVPERIGDIDPGLPRASLTVREMEILRALSNDGTLEEIALAHFVSRNTIKSHVRIIYKKLRVSSRSGAVGLLKAFGEQLAESAAGFDV
jgi:DNA-binding CsgD family transcriptional regulator/tetratricopeptide (TPR) repeat protein